MHFPFSPNLAHNSNKQGFGGNGCALILALFQGQMKKESRSLEISLKFSYKLNCFPLAEFCFDLIKIIRGNELELKLYANWNVFKSYAKIIAKSTDMFFILLSII